jgi:hypothetical protein
VFEFPAQDAQQDLFMIAEEKDRSNSAMSICAKTLDHPGRLGPAVDEVAQENEHNLPRPFPVDLGVDVVQQPIEKVEASVNVSNDIGTPALGTVRRLRVLRTREHQEAKLRDT